MATKDKAAGAAPVLHKLREVYAFMTENNLETVEIDEPGLKLRLVRRAPPAPAQIPVPVFAMGTGAPQEGGRAPLTQGPAPEPGMPAGAVALKSGMMGIFYRADRKSVV